MAGKQQQNRRQQQETAQAFAQRCRHWLLVDCLPVIALLLLMAWAMAQIPAYGQTISHGCHLVAVDINN